MRRLVIVATKFKKTPEAHKVFQQRNWSPARDETTIPQKKRLVERKRHSTSLINLEWEEYEYE